MSGLSNIRRPANRVPRFPFRLNRQSDQARALTSWLPPLTAGNGVVDIASRGNLLFNSQVAGATAFEGDESSSVFRSSSSNAMLSRTQDNCTFSKTDKFSWGGWFYFLSTRDHGLGGSWNAGGTPGYWLYRTSANVAGIGLFDPSGSGGYTATTVNSLANDAWYHIFGTYDGSQANTGVLIYINGVSATLNLGNNSDPGTLGGNYIYWAGLLLGGSPFGDWALNARFKDCRIYSDKLSASEVWALYDPATRYELYQEQGRRSYFFAPSAGGTPLEISCRIGGSAHAAAYGGAVRGASAKIGSAAHSKASGAVARLVSSTINSFAHSSASARVARNAQMRIGSPAHIAAHAGVCRGASVKVDSRASIADRITAVRQMAMAVNSRSSWGEYTFVVITVPSNRMYRVPVENRIYRVPAENRIFRV